jgi:hypothetical protein
VSSEVGTLGTSRRKRTCQRAAGRLFGGGAGAGQPAGRERSKPVPQRRSGRGAPSGPGRILAPARPVRGTKDLQLSEALPLKVETGLLLGRNGRMEAAGDVPAKGAPDGVALADARGRTTAPKACRVVDAGGDAHGRSLRRGTTPKCEVIQAATVRWAEGGPSRRSPMLRQGQWTKSPSQPHSALPLPAGA